MPALRYIDLSVKIIVITFFYNIEVLCPDD